MHASSKSSVSSHSGPSDFVVIWCGPHLSNSSLNFKMLVDPYAQHILIWYIHTSCAIYFQAHPSLKGCCVHGGTVSPSGRLTVILWRHTSVYSQSFDAIDSKPVFYMNDHSTIGQFSVPNLWAVSFLVGWFCLFQCSTLQCASYLIRLLKHNYSKMTKVDYSMWIIWSSVEVHIDKCGFNLETAVVEKCYQIWSMWIRCESSRANFRG